MFEVLIREKQLIAENICALVLTRTDGSALPAFDAGAHVDVHLPSGTIRQYSLLNPTNTDDYEIAVLLDPQSRGGSIEVHEQLAKDQVIHISEPRNLFPLTAGSHHSILIAGGIGVTPILAMARSLNAKDGSFELHYSARSRSAAAFKEKLLNGELSTVSHCYFDDESQQIDITSLLSEAPANAHLYVCGPSGFIDFVINSATSQGWPAQQLHQERFSAEPADSTPDGDKPFEIVIHSSGQVIAVDSDETALEALENAGVEIPVSCEMGICGACLTGVIEGEPDHRDSYLNDNEKSQNRQFTPCCSRANTPRLVLDL